MKSLTTTRLHLWRTTPCISHFHPLNIVTNLCRLIKSNSTTKYFIILNILTWGFNLPAYTQICSADQSEVLVRILTDNYGAETGWKLEDDNGIVYGEALVGIYPNYTPLLYIDTICIPNNICINFTITDSADDGICCGYGNGSYEIRLNGTPIGSGGDFESSESLRFYSTADGTVCEAPIYPDLLELIRLYEAACLGCGLFWDFSQPLDNWEGITATSGKVTAIALNNKGLNGSIPDSLNLPFLTRLDLSDNQLSGEIPNFDLLPNLEELFLGNYPGGNQLSGGIPNFNLPNLEFLSLINNELNGQIPNFSGLPNLKYLWLWNNELVGEIPDFNLPNLEEMSLSNNKLTGEIPDFSGLPKLKDMSFGNNELSGEIPNFSMLPDLEFLYLSENQLSGEIPDFQSPNLEQIWLDDNQLSGSIPNFNQLDNLELLFLRQNKLSGTIPDFTNTQLRQLNLSYNELSGEIPDFNGLNNLEILHLGTNELSGHVPKLENNTKLKELNLYFNKLSGEIPDFNELEDLEKLDLGVNKLIGPIPRFNNNTKLTRIDLHYNNLSDSIPDFTALADLEYLSLSLNELSNTIPNFENAQLKKLYLGGNNLIGSVPDFAMLTNLEILNLSNNQLIGEIPHFDNMPLNTLALDYNKFSYDEIEDYLLNHAPTYFTYSPQYYGEVQSYIIEPDTSLMAEPTSLTLELIPPFQSINNQNVNYQWKRNYDTLVGSIDSVFIITNLNTSNVGRYNLHMTDPTRIPDLEIISEPIYVIIPGYDFYGQPVEYEQLIIEYDDLQDKENYEDNYLTPKGAYPKYSCDCNRLLYLYQFPNADSALQTLLDINTKKETTTRRGRVDGGFNNILGIGPIPGTQGWTWTYDYPPSYDDSVTIFLLDSGADTLNWNARPYLDAAAPIDDCPRYDEIDPSTGYDYTDTLTPPDTGTWILPGHIDSIGHGTFGMRSIAEGSDAYMNMNVVPLKVFDENGQGTLFNFICALYHAIDHDADIINISAGYSGQPSDILEGAVALAHSKGQFIVTATGNEGVNIDSFPQYPAYYAKPFYDDTGSLVHYNNVISVAAIDATDTLWQYSNYGNEAATISAYGENMGGYDHRGEEVSYSGTSISTYYVTRQLAAEIARDKTRNLEDIWLDFEADYLHDCPATTGLTSTGKRLDISLREVYGDLRVFLEGAFDTSRDTMHTDLNTLRHILPGQIDSTFNNTLAVQPYNIAPFYYNGMEHVPTTFSDYPPEVVDWILVSARTEIDAESTVSRTAAWLLEDGRIQLLKPLFDELANAPDSVYIVIEHRSHMGVMSPQKLPVDRNVIVWDFTAQDSYTSIGTGQKMLNDLRWGMLSGDTNSDLDGYDINGCDKSSWVDDNGKFNVYLLTDFNMNGDVNGDDKVLWFHNNGQFSSVPRY